ncbi:MAG: 30S ribosomal protein S4 [Chloroflexota bacterium]|nr:30S ribosomal protein S4 [Chloroflexota bacterium]
MARYIEAVCKQCRREGVKLFLKGDRCMGPKCGVDRRAYAPGVHGQRRRKPTEYSTQLREKQKARRIYGVLERQFRKTYAEAERLTGATGENLLRLMELRVDNLVFRMGFADSRSCARQLVNHGHFTVNGHRLDIPSASLRVGDVVAVSEKSKGLTYFKDMVKEIQRKSVPIWMSLNPLALSGKIVSMPTRSEIDTELQEQLIVEFYSR